MQEDATIAKVILKTCEDHKANWKKQTTDDPGKSTHKPPQVTAKKDASGRCAASADHSP